jgi:acyl dehydratase
VGKTVRLPFTVTRADMDAFARLSGDVNPLHRDAAIARHAGFEGPVVYGAMIVAKVSWLLGMHLPGTGGVWTGIRMDFRNPLYADQPAEISAEIADRSESTRMLTIKIVVEAGGRRIASGAAEMKILDLG